MLTPSALHRPPLPDCCNRASPRPLLHQARTLTDHLKTQELRLTDEEMQQIATLDRNERLANPGFAPKWD
jgi:diketogulonate reductase-like aldo/keto reductase